jgi:hypothetical protein
VHDPDSLFGAYGVAVSGNYAYTASQGCIVEQPCPDSSVGHALDVIEIAGSEAPKIVATLRGGKEPQAYGHITSVAISGHYAYLTAAYQDRLSVVDIANPLSPKLIASLHDEVNLNFPVDVAIYGNYAYVICQQGKGPLTAVDISNPTEPKVVGSLSSPELSGGYRIRIRGAMAYVSASANQGIVVADISSPSSPRLLASYVEPSHLHSTTGLDLDESGEHVVATSTYLPGQKKATFPPYPLEPGGPEQDGTVSVITLDPQPIQATIESEPAASTAQTSASFGFSVNDAVATVQCRLDGGPWTGCTSPTSQSYANLSPGSHEFEVQATDSAGHTSTPSYTWAITGSPANTTPPSVAGSAVLGEGLTASPGSWSGYPAPTFTYQWQRCSAGTCTPIAGATEPSYTAGGADVGSTLTVVVTGTNAYGSEHAESAPTATVTEPAPGGGSGGGSGGSGSGGGGSLGSGVGGESIIGKLETPPTTPEIRAALASVLTPRGKAGRIAAVNKHHGYQSTFEAPAGGVVAISWYGPAKGAHRAGAKPVLVASVRTSVAAKGGLKLTIKLTTRGKSLLKHNRRIKLTSQASFTLPGGSPVTVVKSFTLR